MSVFNLKLTKMGVWRAILRGPVELQTPDKGYFSKFLSVGKHEIIQSFTPGSLLANTTIHNMEVNPSKEWDPNLS